MTRSAGTGGARPIRLRKERRCIAGWGGARENPLAHKEYQVRSDTEWPRHAFIRFLSVSREERGGFFGDGGAKFGGGEDFDVASVGEDAAFDVDEVVQAEGHFDFTAGAIDDGL